MAGGVAPERRDSATWGLAVVAVVLLTRYQPAFLLYPVAAFALAFLAYAQGRAEAPDRGLAREAAAGLGLAWGGTAVAGGLARLLEPAGLSPGGPGLSLTPAALLDLALAPLGLAPPPALFPLAWVLVALVAARALLRLVGAGPAGPAALSGAALLATALAGGAGALEPGPRLLLVRLAFAVAFAALGRAVREAPPGAAARLRSPWLLALGFAAVDVIAASAGGLGVGIEVGALGPSGPAASLATTTLITLMAGTVAWYAAEVVGERSALLAVGRAWRWVLAAHAVVFFALDLGAARLGLLAAGDLPRAARVLNMNRLWVPYLAAAIGLPTLLAALAARAGRARPAPGA